MYDTACGGDLSDLISHGTSQEIEAVFKRPDVQKAEMMLNVCAMKVDDNISDNSSSPITNLNDTLLSKRAENETHVMVLAAFDCAIEKAS